MDTLPTICEMAGIGIPHTVEGKSFLSILDWRDTWMEKTIFPYTPSVTNIYALESVLEQALEEGMEAMAVRATRGDYWETGRAYAQRRRGDIGMNTEIRALKREQEEDDE